MSRGIRVISLAPTQTEVIAALGCIDMLAGVTENCDFPPEVKGISTFGSWYAPDLHQVMKAGPDLVCTFGSHQEEMASTLKEAGLVVYHSDPGTVRASIDTFREIGRMLNREDPANQLIEELEDRLLRVLSITDRIDPSRRVRVLRIMNWEPLITVGPGSFQHDVIGSAGGTNVFRDGSKPYFVCTREEVRLRDPEVIFFCEAFIRQRLLDSVEWRSIAAVLHGRIHIFDCGLTCRSGPRIVDMVEGLFEALYR
jgi:iron complex transport system substrate-binding protein